MEDLTQLQKIAIEGEIAKALSSARHNPEILYRLYVILKNTPKDLAEHALKVVRELTDIEQSDLDRVVLELGTKERPLWIWVEKVIADIKLSLLLAMADSTTSIADMDRKKVHKKIIKSAFAYFCRSTMMICTRAVKELCQTILDSNDLELDFLQDICFTTISTVSELEETTEITETLFCSMFSIQDILSYRFEKEMLERKDKEDERKEVEVPKKRSKRAIEEPKTKEEEEKLSAAIQDAVIKVVTKYEKSKYAVVKKYEGSSVTTILKCYDNEEDAREFIETVKKEYPELLKSCTLTIVNVQK